MGAAVHSKQPPRKRHESVYYALLCTSLVLLGLLHRRSPCTGPETASNDLAAAGLPARRLQDASAGPVRLFVGVLSRSNNTAVRQAIRETWGSDTRLARIMFVVLRPKDKDDFRALREEAVQQGDVLVVSGTQEAYYSITYSTLELFKMAAVLAPQLTHVLKTDEDCFVRVDVMLRVLADAPQRWMYGGHPFGMADMVNRNASDHSRHYVSYHNWASDAPMPPYAWGHGGVLTKDLVKHIAAGAAHMTMAPDNLLVLEDVATGIWVKFVGQEQRVKIAYTQLPFRRAERPGQLSICQPSDALTHLDKQLWPSLADAHRCLFSGACADQCKGEDLSLAPPQRAANPSTGQASRASRARGAASSSSSSSGSSSAASKSALV